MPTKFFLAPLAAAIALIVAAGCGTQPPAAKTEPTPAIQPKPEVTPAPPEDDVAAERAKLTPQDRALVDAQEWCVISDDERLGSMGAPIKLEIKGQPVFICCKGCKKKAEANPDATLAKLNELKIKAKAQKTGKP